MTSGDKKKSKKKEKNSKLTFQQMNLKKKRKMIKSSKMLNPLSMSS